MDNRLISFDPYEVTAVVALPTESGWEYQNETAGVRR